MYLIAGLGNPGRGYATTRHNVGFMAVDAIAREAGIKVRGFRYKGRTGSGSMRGEKVFLLKPRTYMNLSGESVKACIKALKLKPDKLIVIHDDLDLPPGRIRVKQGGGDGGHKGIRSIMDRLGTGDFIRVRIGIGRPPTGEDPVDHVLGEFGSREEPLIQEGIEKGVRAAVCVITEGVVPAMNKFNVK